MVATNPRSKPKPISKLTLLQKHFEYALVKGQKTTQEIGQCMALCQGYRNKCCASINNSGKHWCIT